MEYIKVNKESNEIVEYPYSLNKLFEENPNTSFPATLSDIILFEYGIYEVTEQEPANYNTLTQTIYKGTPYIKNGSWVVDWLVRDLTTEELCNKINYSEFWNNLTQNAIYQTIRSQASQCLLVNINYTEFISLISEAKMGFANPKAIQKGINELINCLTLSTEEKDCFISLLKNGNMNLVYFID